MAQTEGETEPQAVSLPQGGGDQVPVAAPQRARPEAPAADGKDGKKEKRIEPSVPMQWYVIHTQTGQEAKVKNNLDNKIRQASLGESIEQVLVPTERVAEIRGGKKRVSERKFFPGYILVRMAMTDENWHLVRTTAGVTGFIGAGRRPVALSDDEVNEILRQAEERKEKPTPRVTFSKGEGVRVIEGPFTNFNGAIEEVNAQRGKLKVMVSIFGRQTPVELEFWQVERL